MHHNATFSMLLWYCEIGLSRTSSNWEVSIFYTERRWISCE
nr:MAG TPA: hypothetical protein [Caudoviricetes sp.]